MSPIWFAVRASPGIACADVQSGDWSVFRPVYDQSQVLSNSHAHLAPPCAVTSSGERCETITKDHDDQQEFLKILIR